MAGFDHGPAMPAERESPELAAARARLGLKLFFVYLALYGAFILISAFRPELLDATISGVNLAIWYGFTLIVAALVLALVYAWLCRGLTDSEAPR
jgi:uncharacterized membrane protein (DUF485 family)